MQIYFFLFEGVPQSQSPEKVEFAGAYIAIWFNSTDKEMAKEKSINYIYNEGWEVIGVHEEYTANRKLYVDEIELNQYIEYYEHALIDEYACTFYKWDIILSKKVERDILVFLLSLERVISQCLQYQDRYL